MHNKVNLFPVPRSPVPAPRPFPIRPVLRNALTWGVVWGVAGGALAALVQLILPDHPPHSFLERLGSSAFAGLVFGPRFALAGAVIGTAFAVAVGLRYRGRRLAELNPIRFGLLGAVVGGVGVPLYLQLMNLIADGHIIAWHLVLDDARWSTVFGGVAAAVSIVLARRMENKSQLSGTQPPPALHQPTATTLPDDVTSTPASDSDPQPSRRRPA